MNPELLTKSGVICGLGEDWDELLVALRDLRAARVDIVTIGPVSGARPIQHLRHRALVHARRIRRAEALRHVASDSRHRRIPARCDALQLSRLGASGGSDRMTATREIPQGDRWAPDRAAPENCCGRCCALIPPLRGKARPESITLPCGKIGGFCHLYIVRKRWRARRTRGR